MGDCRSQVTQSSELSTVDIARTDVAATTVACGQAVMAGLVDDDGLAVGEAELLRSFGRPDGASAVATRRRDRHGRHGRTSRRRTALNRRLAIHNLAPTVALYC